jgi:nifR3 family TIM-barrel protein
MKIGSLELDNPIIFAPLAGITNLPLRLIAKEAGCGLVCSEMISANGLVHGSRKTVQLLDSTAAEKPLSVQIFGSDAGVMAEAAGLVAKSGADILDINFGCSVKKILKSGSGSALMKDSARAAKILRSVRRAIEIPLTIKIRSGWDSSGDQALEIARLAQSCGVDAITVHPRTATQAFRGSADWSLIKRIKEVLDIPVIGNGDIVQPEDALRMKTLTGCNGIMVGRAAIGNPFIFQAIKALLNGRSPAAPDLMARFEVMLRYLEASVAYLGEKTACYMLRSRLGWFAKGLRHAKHFRDSIRMISSETEARNLIEAYRDMILIETG